MTHKEALEKRLGDYRTGLESLNKLISSHTAQLEALNQAKQRQLGAIKVVEELIAEETPKDPESPKAE